MKLRESGMPDEAYWESLFEVASILDRLGIDGRLNDVGELGSGYGTFTLPIARRICGTVYTFDIDPEMVRRTQERANEAGLGNIICRQADVVREGYGLPEASLDGFSLFNILHGEEPVSMLRQAAGLVRPSGRLWVIHWRYDPSTPRGPSMDIRPRPEQIADWSVQTGILRPDSEVIDLPPWHYGLRFAVAPVAIETGQQRPTQGRRL
jgi:SAM-dependent methyltransferase